MEDEISRMSLSGVSSDFCFSRHSITLWYVRILQKAVKIQESIARRGMTRVLCDCLVWWRVALTRGNPKGDKRRAGASPWAQKRNVRAQERQHRWGSSNTMPGAMD